MTKLQRKRHTSGGFGLSRRGVFKALAGALEGGGGPNQERPEGGPDTQEHVSCSRPSATEAREPASSRKQYAAASDGVLANASII